jgi:hypothetical protein
MSEQTAQLLEAFEALPEEEKKIFTVEFLRRAVPIDSGPLDDEETAQASDQLFAALTVDAKIREGIAELDRGEGIPEGELDAHLARLKAEPE